MLMLNVLNDLVGFAECVNPTRPTRALSDGRLYKALGELQAAGMLPSSHDEAAALAARMRLRGPQDAVIGVLAHVRVAAVTAVGIVAAAAAAAAAAAVAVAVAAIVSEVSAHP